MFSYPMRTWTLIIHMTNWYVFKMVHNTNQSYLKYYHCFEMPIPKTGRHTPYLYRQQGQRKCQGFLFIFIQSLGLITAKSSIKNLNEIGSSRSFQTLPLLEQTFSVSRNGTFCEIYIYWIATLWSKTRVFPFSFVKKKKKKIGWRKRGVSYPEAFAILNITPLFTKYAGHRSTWPLMTLTQ